MVCGQVRCGSAVLSGSRVGPAAGLDTQLYRVPHPVYPVASRPLIPGPDAARRAQKTRQIPKKCGSYYIVRLLSVGSTPTEAERQQSMASRPRRGSGASPGVCPVAAALR